MRKIYLLICLLMFSSLIFSNVFTKEEKHMFLLEESHDRYLKRYDYTTKNQCENFNISLSYNQKEDKLSLNLKFYLANPRWLFIKKIIIGISGKQREFKVINVERHAGFNPFRGGIYIEEVASYYPEETEIEELIDFLSQVDPKKEVHLIFVGHEKEKMITLKAPEKEAIYRIIGAYRYK